MITRESEPIGLPPGASSHVAGEDEAKYSSSNPVVRRLIDRLLRNIRAVAGSTDGTWTDVGIGEGLALEAIQAQAGSIVGIEYRDDKLVSALKRLPSVSGVRGDAGMLPLADQSSDIVTCLEVLEHLTAPDRAVAELARICHGHCVVSVPWEPFFRLGNLLRGKDVTRWGNNPEHVQQFRPSSLHALLAGSFPSVTVHRCFPWLVGVARAS